MDISELTPGLTVKNYKELCSILGERVKTSNAKKAQLAEWERYFKYSRDGNKYIINEIYNVPLDKIDGRINNGGAHHNLQHGDRMDKILMYILNREDKQGELFLPISSLLREMNMINQNYNFGNMHRKKVSKYLNVEEAIVEEFFDTSKRNFKSNIETMLDRLENRSLIFWSKMKTVCTVKVYTPKNEFNEIKANAQVIIDDYDNEDIEFTANVETVKEYRPATTEEIKLILQVEGEIMDSLQCCNKQELIAKNKWKEFITKVNKILFDKANIIFYYDSYKIIRNVARLAKEVEKIEEWLISEIEYAFENVALNKNIQEQNLLNLERRNKKAQDKLNSNEIDDKVLIRASENYLEHGSKVIDTFINMNHDDIRDELKKTKLE